MSSSIKQGVVLKHIIQERDSHKLPVYSELLPHTLQQVLKQYKIPSDHIKEEMHSLNHYLYIVDPSWILPTLETYSQEEQTLFLSSMEKKETALALAEKCSIDPHSFTELTHETKEIFLSILLNKTFDVKSLPLPFSFLSDDPLNALIALRKEIKFDTLIYFLGLFDLAFDIKKILSSSILKALDLALSDEEKIYLKKIQKNKTLVHFSEIGLLHWDLKVDSLRSILYKRGLNRLAKALSESSPQLIWYIHHFLEQSYSKLFQQLGKGLPNLKHHSLLINELLTTIQYLRKK